MIQRKQTLFLVAALILAVVLYFLPLAEMTAKANYIYKLCFLKTDGVENDFLFFPYGNSILNTLLVLVLLGIIFLYKKRNIQMKFCGLAILLNTGIIASVFFYAEAYSSKLGVESVNYSYGLFIPIINAIFIYIALRYIRKDEMLVRAANRLR
ncbi:MAG: DUF4293 domain-containing protein [Flavobacteriales bacterium]|nr:DUF4293 domain-containing protein [Flavobacteriales bacterium]